MQFFQSHDGFNIRFEKISSHTQNDRGTVVLLSGRSEFIEKYHEVISELNHRGWHVATFDWRGQGLSDRMLTNRFKGYVESYDDYLKDLKLFMKQQIDEERNRPVVMLAHSMGAHVALKYLHDYPGKVQKAILTSPLIDIAGPYLLRQPMKIFVKIAVQLGLTKRYATRANDFEPSKKRFSGNRLTRDPKRFKHMVNLMVTNPDLAIGGVTYGWLGATFDSIQQLMAPGYPENIDTPLLMVSAGADRIVSIGAQERFSKRIPNCKIVMIPNALHELLIETDKSRAEFWKAFDAFTSEFEHQY